MAYKIKTTDIVEAVHEQASTYHNAVHEMHNRPESSAELVQSPIPMRFGEGRLEMRKFADTTLSTKLVRLNRDVQLTETLLDSGVFVSINLGAELPSSGSGEDFSVDSNILSLGYSRADEQCEAKLAKDARVHSLSFFFSEQHASQYFEALDRPELIQTMNDADHTQIFRRTGIAARHHHLLARLLDNPYRGALEKLYFESLAGELLVTSLESLCGEQTTAPARLSERDRELIFLARKLLLQDMQNPPTIASLAKQVGLNEDKLKRGFRSEFNTTVFKTLTDYRMRQAAEMVKRRDLSISEIAHETGYGCVSKFILAFKKTYGTTPGTMRKDIHYSLPAPKAFPSKE
ncbi:MAG TPA: hypothetical protein DD979_08110 [Gammaproteobacteria bacterium]|nr:hypothetical protein [Gammaproteobacteria bacterium]